MGLSIKYSALQLGYWVDYLLVSSFATVLLVARGFSASEVGYVTTAGALLAMFMQTYTSSLADKSRVITVKHIIGALIVGAFISGALMWVFPSVHTATFVFMAMAYGLTTSLSPLLTALCLKYNKSGRNVNFGIARSLGSLGYAAASFVAGIITERFGEEIILPIFCTVYGILFIVLLSMEKIGVIEAQDEKGVLANDKEESPSSLLDFFRKYPRYDVFLLSVMFIYFMQMVLGPYMIYFVRDFGGAEAEMGIALSIAAFSEMPAVALGMYFLKKYSAQKLLRVTAMASVVKFVSMVFITDIKVFIALQLIHFFYSGMYMVSSVYYADSLVDRVDAVKAQGLMAVGLTGFVGIVANISAGYMLEYMPVRSVSVLGAVLAVIGMALMFVATSGNDKRCLSE